MSATEFNLPSPKRRRLTDGGDNRDADDRKQQQATSDSKKSSESSTDQQLYTTTLPVPPPPASLESLGAAILRRVANVSDSGVGGAAAAAGDSGSAPASQNDSDELADGSDHFNVPKFPIQRIESQQHKLERQLTLDTPAQAQPVLVDDIDSHTRSVQFQRVIISGDSDLASSAGVDEDVTESCSHLVWAMHVRQRYMRLAGQAFCATTARYLCRSTSGVNTAVATTTSSASTTLQVPQSSTSGADAPPSDHLLQPPPQPHHHHHHHHQPEYTLDSLPKDSLPINLSIESGVFRLTNCPATESQFNCLKIPYVDKDAFVTEHKILIALTSNGPLKSYCFRRLTCLQSKYQLHSFSSKRSLKKHPDEKTAAASFLSLKQIFEAMKITDYDLNIDMLDVHADRHTFQRFDKIQFQIQPAGNHLREVFLKTDNHIGGRFFAEILREVMNDLKESRYQNAELRLSIYGRSADEWDKLAQWALHHGLTEFNDNVRWMIQIPRLFDVYRRHGQLDNFQTFLDNLFRPLFEATIDPSFASASVRVYAVVAFDSVDDESKSESVVFDHDSPEPAEWTESQRNAAVRLLPATPTLNLVPLNALRRERGLQRSFSGRTVARLDLCIIWQPPSCWLTILATACCSE
uniref:A_deaminase domain-containing protein n=1 Tax=Macrostomum lignano TaxID=282301 RepID=A0A1I8J151_9PLAT